MRAFVLPAILLATFSVAFGQTTVSTNVTTFKNRDYVLVSFSNVTSPTAADAVAVVLEGTDLTASVPLRYKWATDSPGYLQTGSGNVTFQLLNQRAGVNFLFFRNITQVGNFSQVELVASSPTVAVSNPNEPVQGHLALTSNGPSYMLVQWMTRDEGTPTVKWGTSSGSYTHTVTGNTTSYTKQDMCGYPANATGWIDAGTINSVLLSGLPMNSTVYYQFGDPSFAFSTEFSFLTGPAVGPTSTVSVLVNADPGHALRDGANEFEYDRNARLFNAKGSQAEVYSSIVNQLGGNGLQQGASLGIAQHMVADSAGRTLAWFNGDLSYARGFATQWDVHFDQFEPLATKMPVMVVEGNHERDWPGTGDRFQDQATDSGGECGIPTWLRYQMPTPEPLREGKYWYSFDHGPIHYLAYSTELDYAPGSEQYAFIQKDLQSVNRTRTPWVIANLHRPIYTTSISGVSQSSDLQGGADQRAAFEDIFVQYQVDLTICGHVHLYQRTCRGLYQKTCLPDNADGSAAGPMHVTLGNGGQWLSYFVNPDMPPYIEALAIEHGYMRYTVNQTSLFAEMVSSLDGHVMDTFQLHKPIGWKNNATAQAALISTFEPNITLAENWVDTYGVDGGITTQITTYILGLLQADPSSYLYIQNATLVQNLNAVDTLQNTLEVLQPVINLLFQPKVYQAQSLSGAAKRVITEVLQPLFSMLNETQSGELMGSGSMVASN